MPCSSQGRATNRHAAADPDCGISLEAGCRAGSDTNTREISLWQARAEVAGRSSVLEHRCCWMITVPITSFLLPGSSTPDVGSLAVPVRCGKSGKCSMQEQHHAPES
jgi:hypothetical protein